MIAGWLLACGPHAVPEQPGEPEVVKPAQRDPRWADARCNDGTPFAFTLRRGDPARGLRWWTRTWGPPWRPFRALLDRFWAGDAPQQVVF